MKFLIKFAVKKQVIRSRRLISLLKPSSDALLKRPTSCLCLFVIQNVRLVIASATAPKVDSIAEAPSGIMLPRSTFGESSVSTSGDSCSCSVKACSGIFGKVKGINSGLGGSSGTIYLETYFASSVASSVCSSTP